MDQIDSNNKAISTQADLEGRADATPTTASKLTDSLKAQLTFLKYRNQYLEQTNGTLQARIDDLQTSLSINECRCKELELTIQEQQKSNRNYRQLFNLAPLGSLSLNAEGHIERVNLAATCILKRSSTRLVNSHFSNLLSSNDQDSLPEKLNEAARSSLSTKWQATLELENGSTHQVLLAISAMNINASEPVRYHVTIVDMKDRLTTEKLLKNANDYLAGLALHDPLTKLPNRTMLSDLLQHQISRKSENGQKLGIIYFDLDGFKPVNDTLGHLAGDHVLCEIANRVKSALGPNDTVARLGGDEFTIILDNPESADIALATARRISQIIRQPIVIEQNKVCVTSSMGISLFPEHARQMDKLLKGADAAMYKAKSAGKDQVCLFSQQALELTDRMAVVETSMASPGFKQQLQLHFQPIVTANTDRIESVEALIRWHHPALGTIAPSEFIPIAEKSNHILEIGTWVLEKACEQKRAWLDEGVDINIAINVSARQLFETDFAEKLSACLKHYAITASSIEIEITESAIMIDHQRCKDTLQQLKTMGHTITVDDFGTGYSALARLARLPVTRVKIDRMFIKDIDNCQKMRSLVRSIINMAHELDLQVVCEGIEKSSQLQSVLNMRSDFFQGFLISEPKASINILSLLSASSQKALKA